MAVPKPSWDKFADKFTALAPRMSSEQQRAAAVAGTAHALHDGYTDLIYIMLQLWQAEFALSYAALGLLRSMFVGAMASLQIPAGLLSERLGSAAVALAVEFAATIAFIDLKLPDMSGYDVARQLHQHPLLQKLRLIALTDSGAHSRREFARAAGFERYLVKPLTRTTVEELLAMA